MISEDGREVRRPPPEFRSDSDTLMSSEDPPLLQLQAYRKNEPPVQIELSLGISVGRGTFGRVYEGVLLKPEYCQVAVKRVLQDARYRNRELDIIRKLSHPNILELKYFFLSRDGRCMYMVFELVAGTLGRVLHQYRVAGTTLPQLMVQLYGYQMLRALSYLNQMSICHRDIKPQNLLIHPETSVLKLCDFGSAKEIHGNEASVAYICSRYYRAPELLLGNRYYSTKVDIWSAGCVIGEMLFGAPLFRGDDTTDMLVRIFTILGVPSTEELKAMNPSWANISFLRLKPLNLQSVLGPGVRPSLMALLQLMFTYTPAERVTAAAAMEHEAFMELKTAAAKLPDGRPLPPMGF